MNSFFFGLAIETERFYLLARLWLATFALVMLLCFAKPRTAARTLSAGCLTCFTSKSSIASSGFDCARWFFLSSRSSVSLFPSVLICFLWSFTWTHLLLFPPRTYFQGKALSPFCLQSKGLPGDSPPPQFSLLLLLLLSPFFLLFGHLCFCMFNLFVCKTSWYNGRSVSFHRRFEPFQTPFKVKSLKLP